MLIRLKSICASIYETVGLLRKYYRNKSNFYYLILMYHRVIPYKEADPGLQSGMYVDPKTFDMHIRYLKTYFNIIHLSEIQTHIHEISNKKNDNPFCVLTFDDGWYDFYKYAFPLLRKHKMPATVFLPTKYIGSHSRFWTDELARLCCVNSDIVNDILKLKNNDCMINLFNVIRLPKELKIDKSISILKKYNEDEIEEKIKEIKWKYRIDMKPSGRVFLNWEEVKEMKESGLITFGSHTHTHKILTTLNDKEILKELLQSKNILVSKGVVSPSFVPFCYPNGNYNANLAKMVREAGYHAAVATGNRWNELNTPLFTLQRIAIHQDISSTKSMFGCRMANIF